MFTNNVFITYRLAKHSKMIFLLADLFKLKSFCFSKGEAVKCLSRRTIKWQRTKRGDWAAYCSTLLRSDPSRDFPSPVNMFWSSPHHDMADSPSYGLTFDFRLVWSNCSLETTVWDMTFLSKK